MSDLLQTADVKTRYVFPDLTSAAPSSLITSSSCSIVPTRYVRANRKIYCPADNGKAIRRLYSVWQPFRLLPC